MSIVLVSRFIAGALMAGFVACVYMAGVSAGGNRELARASAQAIAVEKATATSTQAQLMRLRAEALDVIADNEQLERLLGEKRQASRIVYRTIRQEIPHATFQARSETVDGTACHLDVGPDFVELWDRASDPANAAAAAAASPTGIAAGQAAEADLAARVDLDALLRNHVDNAELAAETREQLEALIDWHLNTTEAPRE